MKNSKRKYAADVLEYMIGVLLAICLFAGGLGFFGYAAAFVIGGETAGEICTWLYKTFYIFLTKLATVTTLFCFVMLYVRGDADFRNPFRKKEKDN